VSGIPKRFRVKWTEEQIALLGTAPDKDISKLLGCHHSTVSRKRDSLGIEPFKVPLLGPDNDDCPKDIESLLGTMLDSELAKRFNLKYVTIRNYRIRRGIVDFNHRMWTPEYKSMLGKMYDSDLAKKMNIHPKKVRKYRRRLGIDAFSSNHPLWKTKTKKIKPTKRKQRNEDWLAVYPLFDECESLRDIADLMECSMTCVYQHRKKWIAMKAQQLKDERREARAIKRKAMKEQRESEIRSLSNSANGLAWAYAKGDMSISLRDVEIAMNRYHEALED